MLLFTKYGREVEVETTANKSSSWQDAEFKQGISRFQILALKYSVMLPFRVGRRGFRKENEKDYNWIGTSHSRKVIKYS